MRSEISETSYGFAITAELLHAPGLMVEAAPVFPSLKEEGGPNGGYDVKIPYIGQPLFLQFKLSDCMVSKNCNEFRGGSMVSLPFYRMHIRPDLISSQHELLLQLEKRAPASVFYAAPLFHTIKEFNEAFIGKQVMRKSIFVMPSLIGELDDDGRHHVSFACGQKFIVCSEPRVIADRVPEIDDLFDAIQRRDRDQEPYRYPDDQGFRQLADDLMDIVRGRGYLGQPLDFNSAANFSAAPSAIDNVDAGDGQAGREPFKNRTAAWQVAYLAQTFFGCTMFIARSKR